MQISQCETAAFWFWISQMGFKLVLLYQLPELDNSLKKTCGQLASCTSKICNLSGILTS